MLITMTVQITGTRDGQEWPAVGGTIDIPDLEAADMIEAGLAEVAPAPAPAKGKKD